MGDGALSGPIVERKPKDLAGVRRKVGHAVGLRSSDDVDTELLLKTKEVMTERFATRRLIPS